MLTCEPASLEVAYSSSNEDVATVGQNGTLTIVGVGSTKITVKTVETETYKAGEASYSFVVRPEIEETSATFGKATTDGQGKDTEVVGPCFTIASTYFAGGTAKVKVYGNDTGMKLRTNKNNQTIIININKGVTITSFTAGLITNDSSKHNTLTSVLVDDAEVDFTEVELSNTSDAPSTGVAVVDLQSIAATSTIKLVFGSTEQVFLAGTLTYVEIEEPEAPASPQLVDGDGNAIDVIELNNANKTIYLSHEDADVDLYWHFAAATQQNAPMHAPATVDHEGKTFNLHTEEGITLKEAGTLSYFAEKNGVRSEVKTLAVTGSGSDTTGIEAVTVEAEGAVKYFNLQGIRVENPANGVFIRRQGNNVSKVLVK